jgi:hypothetical protein
MMSTSKSAWQRACAPLLVALSAALLLACGGGSGGSTVAGIDGTGVSSPAVVAVGAITGFGSVFVNGVEFSTTGSTISINGQTGTEQSLKVGEVVHVSGTIASGGTTGTAKSISYDDNITGVITAINVTQNTLAVMGQAVSVSASTTFDDGSTTPPTLATLAVGNTVEVSGYVSAAGVIAASRIERKAAPGSLDVSGVVSTLNAATAHFNIGTVIIDYTGIQPSGGTLANGICVEARGTSFNTTTLTLMATRVDIKSCAVGAVNGDSGEIEGLITALNSVPSASAADFNIGSQRIIANAQTQYENGAATALALNVKVEAEGKFDANSNLVATEISFRIDGALRATGLVTAVNATNQTVTILGVTSTTSSATRLADSSSLQKRPFGLADLKPGDYAVVRGTAGTTAGSIVAASLERQNPVTLGGNTRQLLRDFVATAATAANFSLLGVPVSANASTVYAGSSGTITTLAAFLAIAAGSNNVVEARCSVSCTPFVADQLLIISP